MKPFSLRRLSALLILALLFTLLPAPALSAPSPAFGQASVPDPAGDLTGQIILLHTNDTHARAGNGMGFAGAAALKQAYEAAGATVLLLDAGDTLHGMPIFNLSEGEPAPQILNATGYDAMVPGNHDFNYGMERLRTLGRKLNFPLLCANLSVNGSQAFSPHTLIEKDGVRIGIFGLTTPETATQTNPEHIQGVTFTDPVKAAKEQVAALKRMQADYIIALGHLGLEGAYSSDKLARAVPGIDVIIDGHSHSLLPNGRKVGSTLIASTGEYLERVGAVLLRPGGASFARLFDADSFSAQDPAVKKLVDRLQASTQRKLRATTGSTNVRLDGEREQIRTGETNLGNLVADAIREAAGANIALCNAGNIRETIPVGKITKAQVLAVLPFANYVVKQRLTGTQVLAMLENGVGRYPDTDGRFPQVSGLRFTFDATKPAGRRISEVWVGDEPLNPTGSYTLATNDFLAAGGDGYALLAQAPILAEYGSMEDIVMKYLSQHKGYDGQAEGRIAILNGK